MTAAWPLRIYYDASCPLCAHEMQALAAHDVLDRLQLVDCSASEFEDPLLASAGISAQQALDFIHARDADGRWLQGVAVFEAAYAAIGVQAMASLLANAWLRPIWDAIYPWVARNRMWLSRLGLSRLFGKLVSVAASRAASRALACTDRACVQVASGKQARDDTSTSGSHA